MKNDENRIEERLLSNASLDELIRIKMEEEIAKTFEKAKQKPQKQIITDIAKVPKKLIFSKFAVYKLFNKSNRTETFINGLQAEAMLGVQNAVRERIGAGKTDVFSTDSAYVKFEKVIIEV